MLVFMSEVVPNIWQVVICVCKKCPRVIVSRFNVSKYIYLYVYIYFFKINVHSLFYF